jgi:hypothetical protein
MRREAPGRLFETTAKMVTPFHKLVNQSAGLLKDLLCQVVNLVVMLQDEVKTLSEKEIDDQQESNESIRALRKNRGSSITVRALKTSIIVMQFNIVESLCNFLGELVVSINDGIGGAPKRERALTVLEIDWLMERKSYFDVRSASIRQRDNAFAATLDKIVITPILFAKMHRTTFRVNKGVVGWEKVIGLKNLRDRLTHFRLSELDLADERGQMLSIDQVKPTIVIESKTLFAGAEAIRWYLGEIEELLHAIRRPEYDIMLKDILFLRAINYLVMLNLYKNCGISDKVFDKRFPMCDANGRHGMNVTISIDKPRSGRARDRR